MLRQLLELGGNTLCFADLLLYLHRHPNLYVSADWLARRLGQTRDDVERSLAVLREAGVLVRRDHPRRPGLSYCIVAAGWGPRLERNASTARWRRQIRMVRRSQRLCERAAAVRARAAATLERAERLRATTRERRVVDR